MKDNKGFLSILLANIVVFILQIIIPGLTEHLVTQSGNLLTLLTSMFAHGSIPHIFFNMLFVAPFAIFYELEIGPSSFIFQWLLCGFGANLFDLVLPHFLGFAGGIGASGACSGIMALAILQFAKGNSFSNRVTAMLGLTGLFMINIIPGIVDCFMPSGIGHMTHVGGILTGASIFLFINSKKKK